MNIITELELLDFIKKHLEEDYAKFSKLEIKNNKGNYKSIVILTEPSVWRFNDTSEKLFAKFSMNKKSNYIAFPTSAKMIFDKFNLKYHTIKSDTYLRVDINDFLSFSDEAVCKIINKVFIKSFSFPSFGCCGKHKECTEKGYCVHSDMIYAAVACQYKKIIEKSNKQ